MTVGHFYVPGPGQTDGPARAAALGVPLADASIAVDLRYATRLTTLPAVVCDHGDDIVVLPEPTTVAAISAAHDAMLQENMPTTTPQSWVTRLTAPFTTSDTAVAAVPMTYPIDPSAVLACEWYVSGQCAGIGGSKFAVTAPAGATCEATMIGPIAGIGQIANPIGWAHLTLGVLSPAFLVGSATPSPGPVRLIAVITNGPTAGMVGLGVASAVKGQVTTLLANSWGRGRKV